MPVGYCALRGWVGVLIGNRSVTWLESNAEIFGGVVLILIGIKMLML
jgi:putative Mn2+ efflux pump MntP